VKVFDGHELAELVQVFTKLETTQGGGEPSSNSQVSADARYAEAAKFMLHQAEQHCAATGLKVSAKVFAESLQRIDRASVTWAELQDLMREAVNTIRRELSTLLLLNIEPDRESYFRDVEVFGQAVATAFPLVGYDVEEAGKCLALDRGTATVFHAMRIMEEGLKYLASLLGIPYAPSWESYIQQISDQVNQKHKHKSVKWKRDEAFFKRILGDLEAVKIAWRNPTMHIVRTYAPSEAEDVFRAVRTLTDELAKRKVAAAALAFKKRIARQLAKP